MPFSEINNLEATNNFIYSSREYSVFSNKCYQDNLSEHSFKQLNTSLCGETVLSVKWTSLGSCIIDFFFFFFGRLAIGEGI